MAIGQYGFSGCANIFGGTALWSLLFAPVRVLVENVRKIINILL
jgi:hypothetical protein